MLVALLLARVPRAAGDAEAQSAVSIAPAHDAGLDAEDHRGTANAPPPLPTCKLRPTSAARWRA